MVVATLASSADASIQPGIPHMPSVWRKKAAAWGLGAAADSCFCKISSDLQVSERRRVDQKRKGKSKGKLGGKMETRKADEQAVRDLGGGGGGSATSFVRHWG